MLKPFLLRFALCVVLSMLFFEGVGQVTIAVQDFETAPATPTLGYTNTGGDFATGNGSFPSDPKYVSGSRGWEVINGTSTLVFDAVNTSLYEDIELSFRLASFSGTSGNGAEAGDYALVSLSEDDGITWSDELQVKGSSNARWSFSSGTGVASASYDGDNSPNVFFPTGPNDRGIDGYSFLSISDVPSVANLKVRIILLNNAAGEFWVIDDVKLSGVVGVIKDEPTNHPTNFTCTPAGSNQIDLSWVDATGGQVPDRYLVMWSDVNFGAITNPTDLVAEPDGPNAQNVAYGVQTLEVTGLNQETTYYFKIFPYTNSGSDIDYKTGVGVLQTSCTTDDGSCGGLETFSNIPAVSSTSYLNRTWTGDGGIQYFANDARTDETINGKAITIRNGELTHSGTIAGGINEMTLTTQRKFTGGSGNLTVYINNMVVGVIPYSGSAQTTTLTINTPGAFTIEIVNSDGDRVAIDDLTWTCYTPPVYDCPILEANIGDACDDGDASTINDIVTAECDCVGTPIASEPTNHPTNFGCFTYGFDEINLIWEDATGGQEPDGYLILWSDISFGDISPPADFTPVNDGVFAQNVTNGFGSLEVTGLSQNTEYFFKIFPYTNSGANIDYKTDGVIETTACTTDPGPCAFETFENSDATSSYSDGSFIGSNGITWTFVHSRDEGGFGINGRGLMLRRSSDDSKVFSSIVPNGVGDFSCKLRKGFTGGSDRQVQLYINNSLIATSIAWDNQEVQTFSVPGINIDGDVVVEIRNITAHQVVVDDIQWTCYSGCTPTQTITDFYPSEGPSQTEVNIFGTGFTIDSEVAFGGVPASSVVVVDDTHIKAKVPSNGLSGRITVTVASCGRQSANSFTVLKNNSNCGGEGGGAIYASDIFISDIYDASSGSLSYIEIFNGTPGPVNLATGNYAIRITTGPYQTHNLTGIIASGETHIIQIGSGSSICANFDVDQDFSGAGGFNGDDIVSLYKGGALLDYVPNPNHEDAGGTGSKAAGFSQSRNSNITSPSTTYNSSEWTISNSENCDNLGIAPYSPAGKNITINEHPADVNCSAVTFTVDATTTDSVPTSYVWRYVAPGDLTWSLVSSLNNTNGLTVVGSGTSSITISGNTSQLLGYQFYVDMGTASPQCRKYSNTASFSFDTRAVYRTINSGDWSDINIWEMSDTEAGPFISPVCQYPIAPTSDKIIIQSGHAVNLDVKIDVDQLEICETCTLTLQPSTGLTVLNGNSFGSDLVVNGTLVDNGTSGNGVAFLDGSTWELASTGTIVKMNTSSVITYRENYEGIIANIPAEANWIYHRIANNDISVVGIDMTYPNLFFVNDFEAGNYNPQESQYNFSGLNSSVHIKGDLNIGMTGTGTYGLATVNTNSTPILIEGSLNIGPGSSLTNEANGIFGTGIEVRGDMNIEGTLDLSSGGGSNVGVLKLTGNEMSGTGTTTISVNHLIIDKNEDEHLNTDLSFSIEKSAEFLNGIVKPNNDGNLFTFQTGAIASGASNNSFVDGKVIKHGTSEEFTFPIGGTSGDTIAWYQPARIFGYTGETTIEAQYFAEGHPLGGYFNSPGDNRVIGACDYWTINKLNSGVDVMLALKFTNDDLEYCNVVGEPEKVFISSLNAADNWDKTDCGHTEPSNEIEMNITIGTDPLGGSYGVFAFETESTSELNVLPIELISFTATPENQKVLTQWSTHSETNNAYFTVERSADARFFHKIGEVAGAGTSHSTRHYSFTDHRPLPNVSYYRLKQTDFDGHYSYSDIKAVTFKESNTFSLNATYRDQNDDLSLIYNSISPYILVEIFDVLGKRVFTQVAENYGGQSTLTPNLGRGAYVVRISSGAQTDSGKIVW